MLCLEAASMLYMGENLLRDNIRHVTDGEGVPVVG